MATTKEAKEKTERIESAISEAKVSTDEIALEAEFLAVELAGTQELALREPKTDALVEEYQREASAAQAAYVEKFRIDTRSKASWAARKIHATRTRFEETKTAMKAEVKRLEAQLERTKAFFEAKLLAWADATPKDVGNSIRLPEAACRLEVRPGTIGGVQILDEKVLVESLISTLGLMEALDLGLVAQKIVLVESATKAFLEAHPGLVVAGAVTDPVIENKKLVIVRT